VDERAVAGVPSWAMSDQGDEDRRRLPPGDGGRTMQIDALADTDAVLEDSPSEEPEDGESSEAAFDGPPLPSRAPPPLPKRGPKKSVVVGALAVVMVLAVGAAFAASNFVSPEVAVVPVAHPPAAPAASPPIEAPPVAAPPRTPITIEEIEITGGADTDAGVP